MADRRLLVAALGLVTVLASGCSGGGAAAPASSSSEPSSSSSSSSSSSVPASPARVRPAETSSRRSGTLGYRTISGASVHFAARTAAVYVPPAAAAHPGWRFPLLELLHGVPGGPSDWLTRGGLAATLDAFAAAHGGRAPVVVVPDINGSATGDTECVRTPSGGDVEAYLASVVPAWALAHLPVTTNHRGWTVAGLSEGATCAAMLALRHPSVFASFGDYSGLAYITLGDTNQPARTTKELFGGSTTAYDQHQPLWLLAHHRYPSTSAWFEVGEQDTRTVPDQRTMVAASRKAGVTLRAVEVPGKHVWSVWTAALRSSLPWFWSRAGLGSAG